jgi:hypothetical protein
MVNVCIGEGLTTDGTGRLTLDTPAWPFPVAADGPFNQPLGLAADGRLYAPPRQIVMNDYYTGTDFPAMNYDAPDTTNPDGFIKQFTITITNPDPGRRMRGIALVEIDIRLMMEGNGPEVTVFGGESTNEAHRFRNDSPTAHPVHFEFIRSLEVNIPPGGTQPLTWNAGTTKAAGTAHVTYVFNAVRILAVSSDPV